MKEQADIMRTIVYNKVANKPASCSHKQVCVVTVISK